MFPCSQVFYELFIFVIQKTVDLHLQKNTPNTRNAMLLFNLDFWGKYCEVVIKRFNFVLKVIIKKTCGKQKVIFVMIYDKILFKDLRYKIEFDECVFRNLFCVNMVNTFILLLQEKTEKINEIQSTIGTVEKKYNCFPIYFSGKENINNYFSQVKLNLSLVLLFLVLII